MREDMVNKGENSYNMEFDETDLKIMQALSDELSEIEVREELIGATLRAAKREMGEEVIPLPNKNTQDGAQKKRTHRYRFWGATITAAAVLLLITLGIGELQGGRKSAQDGDYGAYEMLTQNNFSGASHRPDSVGGSAFEGSEVEADGMNGAGGDDLMNFVSPKEEGTDEWLYQELLAEFDRIKLESSLSSGAPEPESVDGDLEAGMTTGEEAKEKSRRIEWQGDGRTLSCMIYAPNYRLEAVLQEGEKEWRIVLDDWVYAKELWELASDL